MTKPKIVAYIEDPLSEEYVIIELEENGKRRLATDDDLDGDQIFYLEYDDPNLVPEYAWASECEII